CSGLCLATFSGKSGMRYRLILANYAPCHPEGEMLLRFETSSGKVICSATFNIGKSRDGELRIELGCLQGAKRDLELNLNRVASSDFCSTRPKHLLMNVLVMFAHYYDIKSVVCVSNSEQIGSSNVEFYARYDQFWEELGGKKLHNSGFYALPVNEDVINRV